MMYAASPYSGHIALSLRNGSYCWSPIIGAQTENILKNPMAHAKNDHASAVSSEDFNFHETKNFALGHPLWIIAANRSTFQGRDPPFCGTNLRCLWPQCPWINVVATFAFGLQAGAKLEFLILLHRPTDELFQPPFWILNLPVVWDSWSKKQICTCSASLWTRELVLTNCFRANKLYLLTNFSSVPPCSQTRGT